MDFVNIRRILSRVRCAVDEFHMLEDGDVVAVGLSGGKDSWTLLAALKELQRFYPKRFGLCAISVSMGFEGMDYEPMRSFCEELAVPLRIVETHIGSLIFEHRKEKNPCSLCAKMRRGILHQTAKEMGATKLALGHHYDDVVETFMLNLFHEGRLGVFLPVTYMSRRDLTVIRPMLYVPEKDIRYFAGHNPLPVLTNLCPADGETERETMKRMLAGLDRQYKGLKHRIFGAVKKGGLFEEYVPDEELTAASGSNRQQARTDALPDEPAAGSDR